MIEVHPHPHETYREEEDDHCLVVVSGTRENSPRVHISKSMAKWIGRNFSKIVKQEKKGLFRFFKI
jgi:hypothetical protein